MARSLRDASKIALLTAEASLKDPFSLLLFSKKFWCCSFYATIHLIGKALQILQYSSINIYHFTKSRVSPITEPKGTMSNLRTVNTQLEEPWTDCHPALDTT